MNPERADKLAADFYEEKADALSKQVQELEQKLTALHEPVLKLCDEADSMASQLCEMDYNYTEIYELVAKVQVLFGEKK